MDYDEIQEFLDSVTIGTIKTEWGIKIILNILFVVLVLILVRIFY